MIDWRGDGGRFPVTVSDWRIFIDKAVINSALVVRLLTSLTPRFGCWTTMAEDGVGDTATYIEWDAAREPGKQRSKLKVF